MAEKQAHPKRGDVMVIHTPLTIDVLGRGRDVIDGYRVAIVTKGSRRSLAERVATGHGCETSISDSQVWAWTPAATVDVPALRAWMDSAESLTPSPTPEAARDIVRRFRR